MLPEKTLFATPFSTIEAWARSFQEQALNGVTPLQLVRKGHYHQQNVYFSDMACCFACQAFARLESFRCKSFEDRQRLYVSWI